MALQIKFNPLTARFDLVQNVSNLVPTSRTLTINGVTYDLSANRSWTVTSTDNSYKKQFLTGGM
jgi:hypothetical protein